MRLNGAESNPIIQHAIPNNPASRYPIITAKPKRTKIPNWLILAYYVAVNMIKEKLPFSASK